MELSTTVILILITVFTSYLGFKKPKILSRWMFTPYLIKNKGEWDRFILSGLIHKDGVHLLFNMFTFYFFGSLVEQFLAYRLGYLPGTIVFILFYFAAIIISDIPTYIKHQNHSYYHALGASGGTAAAVFASIVIMPLSNICLFGIICLPGFVLGILFLIYTFVQAKKGGDGINHDAHLFGSIFGIIFILILSPSSALVFWNQIINFRPF